MFKSSITFEHIKQVSALGKILSVSGSTIRAKLANPKLGSFVHIADGKKTILAKITAFRENEAFLVPLGQLHGITPKAKIRSIENNRELYLNSNMLGCILDALGKPIITNRFTKSNLEILSSTNQISKERSALLRKRPIKNNFQTGIDSIDTFLTLGVGQRIVLLAEPGVGKSSLILSLAEKSSADLVIFALIGERGREVSELYEELKESPAINKTIIVASTSDEPPLMRAEAANTALRLAEIAASSGLKVCLAFDSLTRYLRSLRDIGLSSGEVPVRRGYPASVFEQIPLLIERAGNFDTGSITAFFTMLSSGEIDEDPFVEEVKGLTDGHIILSRALAERGYFPAIDIRRSLSRLQTRFWNPEMREKISFIKKTYCDLSDSEELLLVSQNMDAYKKSQEKFDLINNLLFPKETSPCEEYLDTKILRTYNALRHENQT